MKYARLLSFASTLDGLSDKASFTYDNSNNVSTFLSLSTEMYDISLEEAKMLFTSYDDSSSVLVREISNRIRRFVKDNNGH